MSERPEPHRSGEPFRSPPPARPSWRTVAAPLGLAWLAAFNTRASLLAIGPLLPMVIAELQLSATLAGLVTGLPLLLMGLLSLPGGLLADRFGPRLVLVGSQLLLGVAGGLRGLADGGIVLLLAAGGLGAGVAITQPPLPQVARAVSPRRTGLATAVYANGLMIGALCGLALTVPLLQLIGSSNWRGALLFWGAFGLLCSLGWTLVRVPERLPAATPAAPMSLLKVFSIRGLRSLAVVFACQGALFYSVTTWLPTYFVAQGWTLAEAAIPGVVVSITSIPGGLLAPFVALRLGGPRQPLITAGVATAVGQIGLAIAPDLAVAWAAIIGLGTSVSFTLGMAAPAELAPRERVGSAAGVLLAIGYLGSVLGPAGVGALRDLTGGFAASLIFLALVGVALAAASATIPSQPRYVESAK